LINTFDPGGELPLQKITVSLAIAGVERYEPGRTLMTRRRIWELHLSGASRLRTTQCQKKRNQHRNPDLRHKVQPLSVGQKE
jgi:hypothetical protein